MKEYKKPLIDVVREAAEGVYATSGSNTPGCDSQYMNGVWQAYGGGWDVTIKEYYGCVGCPAYRNGQDGLYGCALKVDQAYLDGATSYNTDNGKRMPQWEASGYTDDYMITTGPDGQSTLPY